MHNYIVYGKETFPLMHIVLQIEQAHDDLLITLSKDNIVRIHTVSMDQAQQVIIAEANQISFAHQDPQLQLQTFCLQGDFIIVAPGRMPGGLDQGQEAFLLV